MSIKNHSKPKIAIFYDWLNQWGGAEKVLLDLISLYPEAPIYTLIHDPKKTPWLPPHAKIITSFINDLLFSENNPIFYTQLYALALEQFDFSQYDIVISTTSVIGHCLLTPPQTLFVTYFHNINRHLYSYPILNFYQKMDQIFAKRPDAIICNSQTVSHRIQSIYNLNPQIINPGIDTNFFKPIANPRSSYFLIVGRFVQHKRFDLVVKAFKNLPHQLVIIGTGREERYLKSISQSCSNIKFVGPVSDKKLLDYYQNCQALICPQLEDFGLTAIEAQACGKPVIAYNKGGNTETIVDNKTGIFFNQQNVKSLLQAIDKFNHTTFSPQLIRQHSLKFSHKNFMLNFKQSIDHLWQKHQTIMF